VTDLAPVTSARSPRQAVQNVLAALPGRSADPLVCPFLRRAIETGLVAPGATPDEANRCAALTAPISPSSLQQELMCLVGAHAGCPRYRQGSEAIAAGLGVAPARSRVPAAAQLVAAVVVVVLVGAVALAMWRGGGTPGSPGGVGSSGPPVALASSASPSASPVTTVTPTPSPSPTPTPTFPPSPTPSAPPAPTPSTVAPTPSASGSLASHWAGLPKCPGSQACYIYTVKSGDTFYGIASYFGTTGVALEALNPQIKNPSLIHKGDQIKVPPPPG